MQKEGNMKVEIEIQTKLENDVLERKGNSPEEIFCLVEQVEKLLEHIKIKTTMNYNSKSE